MPLHTYPIAPIIVSSFTAQSAAGTVTLTAGIAYFAGVELQAPVTISQMRCNFSGTPTGNVDMGIYDATGTNGQPNNLLGHTGAIAAATGVFTKSLTANLLLVPGQYWLALVDTVGDIISGKAIQFIGASANWRSSATNLTVLANPTGALTTTTNIPLVDALISGSYS